MSDQVETKAFGTYACPRCGLDEPHAHGKGARFKLRTFEYVILGYRPENGTAARKMKGQ